MDTAFGVVKSYHAPVAGIAVRSGVIASLDDRAVGTVRDGTFDGPQHHAIIWRHVLEQTSK